MTTYEIVPRTTPSESGVHCAWLCDRCTYVNGSCVEGGAYLADLMRDHMPDYPYVVIITTYYRVILVGVDEDTITTPWKSHHGCYYRINTSDVRDGVCVGKREWDEFKATLKR